MSPVIRCRCAPSSRSARSDPGPSQVTHGFAAHFYAAAASKTGRTRSYAAFGPPGMMPRSAARASSSPPDTPTPRIGFLSPPGCGRARRMSYDVDICRHRMIKSPRLEVRKAPLMRIRRVGPPARCSSDKRDACEAGRWKPSTSVAPQYIARPGFPRCRPVGPGPESLYVTAAKMPRVGQGSAGHCAQCTPRPTHADINCCAFAFKDAWAGNHPAGFPFQSALVRGPMAGASGSAPITPIPLVASDLADVVHRDDGLIRRR